MDFMTEIKNNKRIQQLEERIRRMGKMKDVNRLADLTGEVMADVILENLEEQYPNANFDYAGLKNIVSPVMKTNHKYVCEMTAVVIDHMYENAGVRLKAVIPEYDNFDETKIIQMILDRSSTDGN